MVAARLLPPLTVVRPPAGRVLANVVLLPPERVAVVSTVTVHEPLAGIVPPLSLMLEAPGASAAPLLSLSVPPQLLVVFKGEATVRLPPAGVAAGNTSLNAAPSMATGEVLPSTKVNVDLAPGAMLTGKNDLTIVGATTPTARLALAPLAFSPPVVPLMLEVLLV